MFIKKTSLLFLFAGCIIAGCDEQSLNDDMPSGKLISIKTPANFYSNYNQVFNFVNSMDGKLLYSKELSTTEENIFEVDRIRNGPSNRYIYTRVYVRDYTTYKSISLISYVGILPFSKDYSTSPSSSTNLGQATVNFSNVPSYYSFFLAGTLRNITSGNLLTGSFNFPIYSNFHPGLFIRINTASGEKYKFIESITPNVTTTIDLSSMNSDFTMTDIDFENYSSYKSYNIYLLKYPNSDFTGGYYPVYNTSTSGSYATMIYPQSFLPNSNCRIDLNCYGDDYYSYGSYYSKQIPVNINPLWGYFALQSNFPEINYSLELSDKADYLYFTWQHSATFRDNNGFRVVWNVYISPSIRDFTVPSVPGEVLDLLSSEYSIGDLNLSSMESQVTRIGSYSEAIDYDEYIKKYWFGWKSPVDGTYETQLYYNPAGSKGTKGIKPFKRPGSIDTDTGY